MFIPKYLKPLLYFNLWLVLFPFCSSCTPDKPANSSWQINLPGLGTASSPRMADLNRDGILDMVLGAGGTENQFSDTAIIALNGADGSFLWKVPGRNQMVGSAIFKDISGDSIPDVFIGGRTGELMAINGSTGQAIWRYYAIDSNRKAAEDGIYNFYIPQFISDQDQDGKDDLLITNGGNYLIKAYDPNRPVGRLMVISSATGKIIISVPVPDGKETYMSVVKVDVNQTGTEEIIFGTGGETIGGKLYRIKLQDLLRKNMDQATVLAESEAKGFIAPPVMADITLDGVLDIIANAVDGKTLAIDGSTNKLIWETSIPGTELYSSPAVGYFNQDSIPDFFINCGIGIWPRIIQSTQCFINGANGKIEARSTTGSFMYASPVVSDFNHDGFDEVLLNVNKREHRYLARKNAGSTSQLYIFDLHGNRNYPVGDTLTGKNIACTPWVGDTDQDGKMDIICSTIDLAGRNSNDIDQPTYLRVFRLKTDYKVNQEEKWSAYMGKNHDGVFRGKPSLRKPASAPEKPVAVTKTPGL